MERTHLLLPRDAEPRVDAGLSGRRWSPATLRTRFADLSPGIRSDGRGDHDLNPGMLPAFELREAAVLVPLVDRPGGITILLTRRTEHLRRHAGQIAFPGGRVEEGDRDHVATALRETEEEIGLPRDRIEPIGALDRYVTRTGFTVTPVVGLVHPPFSLSLDAHEVADSFEVPLDFVLDPANRQTQGAEYQGIVRHFYVFQYGPRHIWGATAGMLVNLAEALA